MNILSSDIIGLAFVLVFFGGMVVMAVRSRNRPGRNIRDISAFAHLRRVVGLAVESGTRLHISIGWESTSGQPSAPALAGLSMLERITRAASISDRPPVVTSGDGTLAMLSQDTIRAANRAMAAEGQYDPNSGRVSGLTPFSYAAGAMPVIYDEQVSANVIAGHFGLEVALIIEAGDRKGSLTVAGTDQVPVQAVLYAAAQEPLIGEELYAGGAYLGSGLMHLASLRTQDIFRWVIVAIILLGAIAKLVGSL